MRASRSCSASADAWSCRADPAPTSRRAAGAAEESSHPEVIGTIVVMLNKGMRGPVAEGLTEAGEMFRMLNRGGDSHVTSLLYGASAALTNSGAIDKTR